MQIIPFPNAVSARDIQRQYRKVFDKVKKTQKPVVVMSNNKPQAAIISLNMLEDYLNLQLEQATFTVINRIRQRNKAQKSDQVYKQITNIVEGVRQEKYEKSKGGR